ncbi:MAG: tetratricopeptide repeat protein [Limnohabitans sp.]|nr:tetratricopeptide repeat protein [Limnohabitans sp.]
MGLFDFFKKKTETKFSSSVSEKELNNNKTNTEPILSSQEKSNRITTSTFNSVDFQTEACAIALWKIKENNYRRDPAIRELENIGLDNNQVRIIMDKVTFFVNEDLNEKFTANIGITPTLFDSENYQNQILVKAENWYQEELTNYGFVKFKLLEEDLNITQADLVISKLSLKVAEMVKNFQSELDSGFISEIKIQPNPEHKKGNVDKEQIDKYIGYGAYQMDRGDLENALELFDKAIELDEKATLAYANKGKLYSLQNDNDKALYFINKALEIEPNHPQILNNKVDILFDLLTENKITEAEFISIIKEILSKDSENPNALIYIIQYYLGQKEIDNAKASAKKLFKNYYTEQISTQLLLSTFAVLPIEDALQEFEIFEKELNEDAKYQLNYAKGLYLKGMGKFEDAINLYNTLNKLHPFSWNYYQIAIMKNLQGKTDECFQFLKQTFNLEPELKEDAKHYYELQNLSNHSEFIQLTKV